MVDFQYLGYTIVKHIFTGRKVIFVNIHLHTIYLSIYIYISIYIYLYMRTSRSQGRTVFLLGQCLITCSNLTSYCNRILYIRGVDLCLMNVSLTAMCPGPRTTNTRGGYIYGKFRGGFRIH